MHPLTINKYFTKGISALFVLTIILNILLFKYQNQLEEDHTVNILLNIPLLIYCLLIAIGGFIHRKPTAYRLFSLCIAFAVITFMRTGIYYYFSYLISYIAIFSFVMVDKEKERKKNYSLKIQRDKIRDEYNTYISEHEKDKFLLLTWENKLTEIYRLKEIATAFNYSLTSQEITNKVIEILTQTIKQGSMYSLYLIPSNGRVLQLISRTSKKGFSATLKETATDDFNKWIMLNRKPLLISDIEHDYRFNTTSGNFNKNIKSIIAAPLQTEDKIIGILRITCGSHEEEKYRYFNIEDLRLLSIIANMAALSVRNARLFKETQELAIKDGLTSLFVVRHFKEKLKELITAKEKVSFCLLMLDLDKFKNINDSFGHMVGDTVLRKVASVIKAQTPKTAIVSRYGGEEFAIILTEASLHEASEVAENIRHAVSVSKIGIRREKLSITISIGISTYPAHGETMDEIIDNADKALYKSKKEGRNKVTICKL